jgi:hypothetical protein
MNRATMRYMRKLGFFTAVSRKLQASPDRTRNT